MSAAVLPLPTAAPAQVVQRRRRGLLPKAVQSLSAYRQTRMWEQQRADAANVDDVKNLCADLLRQAMRGEIKGLIVVVSKGGEEWGACARGDYAGTHNRARLLRSAQWLADVVVEDPTAERKP